MYENAHYSLSPIGELVSILCIKNGSLINVPLDQANTDYQNIMQLVDSGELTIQPAEANE